MVRLEDHREDVYSQFGEDGMIRRALELLPDAPKWCVELGAWDGRLYSNTYRLMTEDGWSGVFIEADPAKFRELQQTYAENEKAVCVNAFAGLQGESTLDEIFARTPVPQEFALLSLDVDGDDWHLWASLTNYRPELVVVEFNSTIPPDIDYVQAEGTHQGSSLAAFARLGKEKGYELIAASDSNAFFVVKELFPLFGLEDNSPEAIHPATHLTRVFQLFDGTLCFEGCTTLLWHGAEFGHLQAIPRWARFLPDTERTFGQKLRSRLWVELLRLSGRSHRARRDSTGGLRS